MEQERFVLLEHLSSSPIFSGVRVIRSLVLGVCFVLLSVLRYTDSDYPFGIFKLFLKYNVHQLCINHSNLYKY